MMEKYINEHGKQCYKNAILDDEFKVEYFHLVEDTLDQTQYAFHSNLGSLTVVDRLTGFGHRDTETGFCDKDGKFWLASGNCDVMSQDIKTIWDAIYWVKKNANTCNPDTKDWE